MKKLLKIERPRFFTLFTAVLCSLCCTLSAVTYQPLPFHSTSIFLPSTNGSEGPQGVLAEPPACAPLAQAPYRPLRRDYNDGLSGGLDNGLDEENEIGVVSDMPLGDPLPLLLLFAVLFLFVQMNLRKGRYAHEGFVESIGSEVRGGDHARLVGIDRVDAVIQDLGDHFVMGDSQTDENENTHLGV